MYKVYIVGNSDWHYNFMSYIVFVNCSVCTQAFSHYVLFINIRSKSCTEQKKKNCNYNSNPNYYSYFSFADVCMVFPFSLFSFICYRVRKRSLSPSLQKFPPLKMTQNDMKCYFESFLGVKFFEGGGQFYFRTL